MLLDLLAKYQLSLGTFVSCLRFAGGVLLLLALIAFIRVHYLSNALTITEAKKFIRQQRKPFLVRKEQIRVIDHAPPPVAVEAPAEPAPVVVEKEPEYKVVRRTVIQATISEEAQALLDKLAVPELIDNGWCGTVTIP